MDGEVDPEFLPDWQSGSAFSSEHENPSEWGDPQQPYDFLGPVYPSLYEDGVPFDPSNGNELVNSSGFSRYHIFFNLFVR